MILRERFMRLRGFLMPVVVILLGCSNSSRLAYRNAGVVADQQHYRLTAGDQIILERCSERSFPLPDAASGFCIYLPIPMRALRPGSVIRYTAQDNPAYLWELHAPGRYITSDVDASLQIIAVSGSEIRARLHALKKNARDDGWAWAYDGEDRYEFTAVAPESRQRTF